MVNQNKPKVIGPSQPQSKPGPKQKPSMQNVYNSTMLNTVKKLEAGAVGKHNKGVVDSVLRTEQGRAHSELTGQKVDMKHSNMMPFYRGNYKQSVDPLANNNILEQFGAKNDLTFRKKEIAGMFVPEANVNRFDPNMLDDMTIRVNKPVARKNVLPFEQVKVGRGVGAGFGDKPSGGFHQTNLVDLIKPKSVDELRVLTNPKLSGTPGYTAPGKKGENRGIIGSVEKRRPDTAFEMGEDRLMKTTGAVLGKSQQPVPEVRDTSRTIAREVMGGAHVGRGDSQRADVQGPNRSDVLSGFTAVNVHGASKFGDYGKESVQVYTNGRDVTTTQTYKGNVQSLIKAIIAPITDAIKTSKKEWFIDPAREFGQMSVQIPSKATVYDPNDVTRTTIKQTLLQDSENLNMRGQVKGVVYDPNNVTRTTIKQTLLQDSENLNMRGPIKLTVYDPADVARTTTRQTMLQQSEKMNMSSHTYKNMIFDPNAVARTTVKETLLQDTDPANLRSAEIRGTMYKPDDKTRTTGRETLDLVPTTVNFSTVGVVNKGTVYDPTAIARPTIKETNLTEGPIGIVGGRDGIGSYVDTDFEFDFKNTQKDTYTDLDYFGAAQIGFGGEGYQEAMASFDLEATMKETTTGEYYGVAESQGTLAPPVNDGESTKVRVPTLVERDPTHTGTKSATGMDGMNMEVKRMALPNHKNDQRGHIIPDTKSTLAAKGGEFTKARQCFNPDDRLDMEILEPFKKNPFTQSLHSFA